MNCIHGIVMVFLKYCSRLLIASIFVPFSSSGFSSEGAHSGMEVSGGCSSKEVSSEETSLRDAITQLIKISPDQIKLKISGKKTKTSRQYSFELDKQKYLVKTFSDPAKSSLKKRNSKRRDEEIEKAKIFSELGLGAKLVAIGAGNFFYIREYVPGKTLSHGDLKDNKTLVSLAKAIKKLHKYKSEIKARGLVERLEENYKKIKKKKTATPTGFDLALEKGKAIAVSLKSEMGFCHNDLIPRSILQTAEGAILFINLMRSGNANIFEELGYMTLANDITGERLDQFLKAYYDRTPTKDEINSVKSAQKLACLVLAAYYFAYSESKRDKEIDLKIRRANLDKLIESNDLQPMQEYINKCVSIRSRNKAMVKQFATACYKRFLEL